jgi:hypothetical protein
MVDAYRQVLPETGLSLERTTVEGRPSTYLRFKPDTLPVAESLSDADKIVVSVEGQPQTVTKAALLADVAATLPDNAVEETRTISTAEPLRGGGDLTQNRTLTLGGLTALGNPGQVPAVGIGAMEWKTVQGTNNQITVTNGPGVIGLAGPQDLHTGASPGFAGLTVTGTASLGAIATPSTMRVDNLNADKLDGLDASAFAAYDHTHDGSVPAGTYAPLDHDHDARYSLLTHDHDAAYLGKTAKAADSDLLDGLDSTAFAPMEHIHDYSAPDHTHPYEPAFTVLPITKGGTNNTNYTANKFLAYDGAKLASTIYDHASFATDDHGHDGVYLPVEGKAADSELLDGLNSDAFALAHEHPYAGDDHDHDTTYLKLDASNGPLTGDLAVTGKISASVAPVGNTDVVRKTELDALSNVYLGKTEKAADSDKLDGLDASAFAEADHSHTGYESSFDTLPIAKGGTNAGSFAANNKFLAFDGTRLVATAYDQNSFAEDDHDHAGTYLTAEADTLDSVLARGNASTRSATMGAVNVSAGPSRIDGIVGLNVDPLSTIGIYNYRDDVPSNQQFNGIFSTVQRTNTANQAVSGNAMIGLNGNAAVNPGAGFTEAAAMTGVLGRARNVGTDITAVLSSANAMNAQVISGGGKITNAYGLNISAPSVPATPGGSIGTAYGLMIGNQKPNAGVTTAWQLYSAGNNPSYFAGPVQVNVAPSAANEVVRKTELDGHNHDAAYLGKLAKAADSDLLDGHDTAYFATADHTHEAGTHNHDATYLKLDASNDPITGDLAVTGKISASVAPVGNTDVVRKIDLDSHLHEPIYFMASAESWLGSPAVLASGMINWNPGFITDVNYNKTTGKYVTPSYGYYQITAHLEFRALAVGGFIRQATISISTGSFKFSLLPVNRVAAGGGNTDIFIGNMTIIVPLADEFTIGVGYNNSDNSMAYDANHFSFFQVCRIGDYT